MNLCFVSAFFIEKKKISCSKLKSKPSEKFFKYFAEIQNLFHVNIAFYLENGNIGFFYTPGKHDVFRGYGIRVAA